MNIRQLEELSSPTFDTIANQVDNEGFIDNWRKDRARLSLGGMAAATLEYSIPKLEHPDAYFSQVADAIEVGDDRYTVFLKQPVGMLGYRALIASIQPLPYRTHPYLPNLTTGFVARNYYDDAPKLLEDSSPKLFDAQAHRSRYQQARRSGVLAVRPSSDLMPHACYDARVIYSRQPVLSENEYLQEYFVKGVEENFREAWTEDVIERQTEAISLVKVVDGALIQEAGVVTARDFADALHEINQENGFYGEDRSRGPYGVLTRWLALQETHDQQFADSVDKFVPDSGQLRLRGRGFYDASWQVALDVSVLREVQSGLESGRLTIPDFGKKSISVLGKMIEQYDTRQAAAAERVAAPRPTIERLSSYDASDAKDLGVLLGVLSEHHDGSPVSPSLIESIILSNERDQLVARIGEKIVGTATLNKIVALGTGPRAFLDAFVVLPEVRGTGVADLLWRDMQAWCQE